MWDNESEHSSGDDFDDDGSPELPLPQDSHAEEKDLVVWILIFIMRLQAKHYIPDVALACLIKFLFVFFSVVGRTSSEVAKIASSFPKSLFELRQKFVLSQKFKKLVVCYKCHSIYNFSECVERCGVSTRSRKCSSREHKNSSRKCDHVLLKTVELSRGNTVLRPFKVYCYRSLASSLQRLLQCQAFVSCIESWRLRQEATATLSDIYDGQLWKDFMYFEDAPFLACPYSLALAMNIDWFQPYKWTESSVGAIYLTVMNLPYHLRFKREFVILAGIIPGPREPKRDVNSYLRPLISELLDLWNGMPMEVIGEDKKRNIRCALICVACDMPASRKTCGFLGHTAKLGCNKCKKVFTGSIGNKNYSGFDRENWESRSNLDHRSCIATISQSRNQTERNQLESELGCRYSVLLDLPYFDPVRMTVIDPMHNLFLGTAKYLIKNVWIQQDILTKSTMMTIQNIIDGMSVPTDLGRIPGKIQSGFDHFTADQFKNWVNLYSIPCLYGILSSDHLENWRYFVLACRILCRRSLTLEQVALADALLLKFCKRTEQLYGPQAITPNMHMHCHLRNCLLDYGPVYSFWCFSYERYNGILGNQPSSNREIEPQLMTRFLRDNSAYSLACPNHFQEDFHVVSLPSPRLVGSLLETTTPDSKNIELPKNYTRVLLDSRDKIPIVDILIKLENCENGHIEVNSIARKYTAIIINKKRLSSHRNQSCVMFEWDKNLLGETRMPTSLTNISGIIRPAKIINFLQVSYKGSASTCSSDLHTILLAHVSWYLTHPDFIVIGKPAQIWCNNNMFEMSGYIPMSLYRSRCVHCVLSHNGENVLVVVPLVE